MQIILFYTSIFECFTPIFILHEHFFYFFTPILFYTNNFTILHHLLQHVGLRQKIYFFLHQYLVFLHQTFYPLISVLDQHLLHQFLFYTKSCFKLIFSFFTPIFSFFYTNCFSTPTFFCTNFFYTKKFTFSPIFSFFYTNCFSTPTFFALIFFTPKSLLFHQYLAFLHQTLFLHRLDLIRKTATLFFRTLDI